MNEIFSQIPEQELAKQTEPDHIPVEEVVNKIQSLEEGECLTISHCFSIVRMGGKTVAFDPALEGVLPPKPPADNFLIHEGKDETLRSSRKGLYENISYASMICTSDDTETNAAGVGKRLGDLLDLVLVSHIDPDHMDFELIRSMMEVNSALEVYGPLGWKRYLARTHYFEEDPSDLQEGKDLLPNSILSRLKSFSALNVDSTKGLRGENFATNSISTGGLKINTIEVPHLGGTQAEYNQSFVLEAEENRLLYLSDAGLSPELIKHISTMDNVDNVLVSTGVYNDIPFYFMPNKRISRRFRELFEEPMSHSTFSPIALRALLPDAQIKIIHHGYYFSQFRNDDLGWRLPIAEESVSEEASQEWLRKFRSILLNELENFPPEELHHLASTFGKNHSASFGDLARDFPKRFKFAKNIIDWLKAYPIPAEYIASIEFAQQNEVIS